MIDYIEGELEVCRESFVILKSGNIGYKLNITKKLKAALPKRGEKVRVYTHLMYKEPIFELYGFVDELEREVFLLLLSVQGVGSKLAQNILLQIKTEELIAYIKSGSVKELSSIVSGLGKKTSERLNLELKSKVEKLSLYSDSAYIGSDILQNKNRLVIEALKELGYSEAESGAALKEVLLDVGVSGEDKRSTEDLLKEVLIWFNKR